MQGLQVDRGVLQRDDEQKRAALVLEEEVFRVPAGDFAAQPARFLDGEERRVADGAVLDLQAIENGEQIGRRCGHGGGAGGLIEGSGRRALDPCHRRPSTPW